MCKFCNFTRMDSFTRVKDVAVNLKVGNKIVKEEVLSLCMDMSERQNKDVYLAAYYWDRNYDDDIAEARVRIKYCPFCGRKFNNKFNDEN